MSGRGTPSRAVGARITRVEDPRFLTGRGQYVDDLRLPGMLEVAFVRSTEAHAGIRAIDIAATTRIPGVVGVYTARELDGIARPIRARNSSPGYNECDTPVLASGKVRMVGEPVAAVVAETRYHAEDGAAAVTVDYERLPVITTIEAALAAGAPAIHEDIPDNLFNSFQASSGDVDAAFDEAHEIVELELRAQRYGAVALEGRAVVASYDGSEGRLSVWLSSQVPHLVRTGLSRFLGLPENKIRVVSPDVGGGFGPKCVLYQEDVALGAITRILGAPVKWTSDRTEDLQTTVHGREQIHRIRAGATEEGQVTVVEVEIHASNGAYAPWPFTAALDSGQAAENVTGPYAIPNYRCRVNAVITNKAPMGPYRGVGRVMACFSMERVMDELARRLRIDPLEVRRRNVVRHFPHTTAMGLRFESGDYVRSLDLLREHVGYDELRAQQEHLRAAGRHVGVGVACAVEHSAYGPKALWLTQSRDHAGLRHVIGAGGTGRQGCASLWGCTAMARAPRHHNGPDRGRRVGIPVEDIAVVDGEHGRRAVRYGYMGQP